MTEPGTDDIDAARAEVIEAFERSAEVYGLNRSYGRLYGILFFADDPLSLDAIVERSGYAKSTVSTALRAMDRLHFVHRRSISGEGKKAYYEAERDFWRIIQQLLSHEVMREISIMQQAIASATETLETAEGADADRDLAKLRSMLATYDTAERLVGAVTGASADGLAALLEEIPES